MNLENTYAILSAQARKLLKEGKVTEYMRTLLALNILSEQKNLLQLRLKTL